MITRPKERGTDMHDCLCCSHAVYSEEDLCSECQEAGCEANDNKDSDNFGIYDNCQVPDGEEHEADL